MITDIWTETFIEEFSEKEIQEFQEIVLRDIRNKCFNDHEKEILRSNLDLWIYNLRIIRKETELKLSQIKTNIKIKMLELHDANITEKERQNTLIVEQTRRNNTIKFLGHVEQRMLYVKLLLQQDTENSNDI